MYQTFVDICLPNREFKKILMEQHEIYKKSSFEKDKIDYNKIIMSTKKI